MAKKRQKINLCPEKSKNWSLKLGKSENKYYFCAYYNREKSGFFVIHLPSLFPNVRVNKEKLKNKRNVNGRRKECRFG
jgi:hypothetical protein